MNSPPDGPITTEIINDEAAWDLIRREWDELYAASPTASTPLDYFWLRNWWRIYQPTLQGGELSIATVRRSKRLIGAIPLYLRRGKGGPLGVRRLAFLSTGEAEFEETCPDYMNLLHLPGEEAICASAVWQTIGRTGWDQLELLDLPEDTPLLRAERSPSARTLSRGACPVADLTGGFDAYLGRLSSSNRQQARRLLREGEGAGVRFEIIGAEQLAAGFDDLVRLHQTRWTAKGKPGVFAAPRFVEFHLTLLREWLPTGRAILARLSLASEPIAVLYGFVTRGTFDFYQSGVRLEASGQLRSPGNLAHLLLMRALAERGITAYDFLRGSSSYKKRLATRENRLVEIRIWRPTLRTAVHLSAQLTARSIRKLDHLVRRRAR